MMDGKIVRNMYSVISNWGSIGEGERFIGVVSDEK